MGEAAERWRTWLGEWAIPQDILARAPESPWGCPPELFRHRPEQESSETPSRRRALEALPSGGRVLDIGVGGGAASLPLAPPATFVTGVDESPRMLASFAAAARRAGIAYQEILGRWPDVAPEAPTADVVVCHHVFYNVPELDRFAAALGEHARARIVVELTETHPHSSLNNMWKNFHGIERPERPTAADALGVLAEIGLDAHKETFERPPRPRFADPDDEVAFVRKRLCLTPDRDAEIRALLDSALEMRPRRVVTLWWDV